MTNPILQAMQSALAAELLHAPEGRATIPTTQITDPKELPIHLVQDFRPFSESLIWELQRRFFEENGSAAWSKGVVPHYVTSNSFIAKAYAQVAMGFLRDVAASGAGQTVHIVELGTGVGQFSFHFIHWLDQAFHASALPEKVRFRYVMTDFAEENIRFWQQHDRLSGWLERGLLDFARFDVTRDDSLHLLHSGDLLSPSDPPGPVFLIANYLFDTIPQALFRLEQGSLCQSEIRLHTRSEAVPDPNDASLLPRLLPDYRHLDIGDAEFYAEPFINQVLEHYQANYTSLSLLFPHHGLRCMERFRAMAGGELFVLSGDKGFFDESSLLNFRLPGMAHHGSFSLMVNYHAMGVYAGQQGGEAWFRHQNGSSITVCGFCFSKAATVGETKQAWENSILAYGPDDFFQLKAGMERNFHHFQPAELLAYIAMTGYDPKALRRCLPYLLEAAKGFDQSWKEEFLHLVARVMANYYAIGEKYDLEREVKKVLQVLG